MEIERIIKDNFNNLPLFFQKVNTNFHNISENFVEKKVIILDKYCSNETAISYLHKPISKY